MYKVAVLPLHFESSIPPQQDGHWQKPYEELTVMGKSLAKRPREYD